VREVRHAFGLRPVYKTDVRGERGCALDLLGHLLKKQHLVQEPGVDAGGLVELSNRGSTAHGLLEVPSPCPPSTGWSTSSRPCAVEPRLLSSTRHGLLESFRIGATDRHGLANRFHGGGEPGALDEIPNDITGSTPASFEPTLDYVVVKGPRFAFETFLRPSGGLLYRTDRSPWPRQPISWWW